MKIVSVLISAIVFLRVAHGDKQTGRRVTDNATSSEGGEGVADADPLFRFCRVWPVLFYSEDTFNAGYDVISSNGYEDIPFYSWRSLQLLGLYTSVGLLQPKNRVGQGSLQFYSARNGTDFGTQITFAFTPFGDFSSITGGSLLASGVSGFITPFKPAVLGRSLYKLIIICDADLIEVNRDRFGIDDTPYLFNEPSVEVIKGVFSSDGSASQNTLLGNMTSIGDFLSSYQGKDMEKAH